MKNRKSEVIARGRGLPVFLLVTLAPHAVAQGYPAKPIRVVLPVAPGGGSDIIVRVVTQKVTAAMQCP